MFKLSMALNSPYEFVPNLLVWQTGGVLFLSRWALLPFSFRRNILYDKFRFSTPASYAGWLFPTFSTDMLLMVLLPDAGCVGACNLMTGRP